jgi:hypothetical protein
MDFNQIKTKFRDSLQNTDISFSSKGLSDYADQCISEILKSHKALKVINHGLNKITDEGI